MPPTLASALLTTRGGAYRDIRDFDAAERCAREAIAHNDTDPHPYSLLAAIHFQRGDTEEGDACLAKVEQLGWPVAERQAAIEHALRPLDDAERTRMIETLQQLNPARYGWIATQFGQGRKASGERRNDSSVGGIEAKVGK